MANGKLRDYYWRVTTFLAECLEYLDSEHSAYAFPSSDEVENTGILSATLVFRDGSRLYIRTTLDNQAKVREYDYAYIYLDHQGNRIFQYDDSPHHPEVSTHPHHLHRGDKPKHGRERVDAIDLAQVYFIAVVDKIITRLK